MPTRTRLFSILSFNRLIYRCNKKNYHAWRKHVDLKNDGQFIAVHFSIESNQKIWSYETNRFYFHLLNDDDDGLNGTYEKEIEIKVQWIKISRKNGFIIETIKPLCRNCVADVKRAIYHLHGIFRDDLTSDMIAN